MLFYHISSFLQAFFSGIFIQSAQKWCDSQKVYFLRIFKNCFTDRGMMLGTKLCKTVRQYNKVPLSAEDMQRLLDIATDYNKIKNYVYDRYGGIKSLSKLYPGYTVQNEMTASGLRMELAMPSVYFYLAVFDALSDIKSQWASIKLNILRRVGKDRKFSAEEKHYLRFLLKSPNGFEAVLNQKSIQLPMEMQANYQEVAENVDTKRLNRYLCRQVRKCHVKLHSNVADGFSIAERAYRYADHGIYISTKQNRKRIFVLLTDSNRYKKQLYIKLYPEEKNIEIIAAVSVRVHLCEDYTNQVGVAFGLYTMLTTHEGHAYGERFGDYQMEYADWLRKQGASYQQNRADNPGRKKYQAKKRRMEEHLHSYINHELNCFFIAEKPHIVYFVKMPGTMVGGSTLGFHKRINNSLALWQRGYIKKRLIQKCREKSVLFEEVLGKDISNECSSCGAAGSKKDGMFICGVCGCCIAEKTNTARNILNRGLAGKILH